LFVRDQIGDFDHSLPHDPVHDADVLGEAAARGLKARGDAGLFVERALRGGSLAAVVALVAGNVMMDDDALTDAVGVYAFPDSDNGSRHLVTEDAGSGV